ncbi:MAG: L,D-transpeptidase family protein [Gammaproteobacteria bacterium]|nr:L,D-transpeptidase family protein [Gammaproteobacteria bacterium]
MRLIIPFLMLTCLVHTPAGAVNELPAYLIRLPDSVKTVFVAETSAAAFHRFDNAADMKIDYQGTHYMSIGENGDGKQDDGDRRTPLGIYFVTEQLDTSKLHEKYGVTAFTLDYPNAWDRRMQRTGDGIWVHGVDRRGGKRPALDTDGCIALPNETLTKLENRFQPNVTPVVIARELKWVDRDALEELRVRLNAAVSRWAESLQDGDLHAYLSLYDDDFRHWGMNKTEWTVFSVDNLGSRSIEKVSVSDLLLLADPAEDEIYLSRFRLGVTEGSNTVEVTKRLYWHAAVSGDLKIIAEDSG